MLPEKKRNTNIGVGFGIILQVVAGIASEVGKAPTPYFDQSGHLITGSPDVGLGLLATACLLGGLGLFVWGCMNYAEGKGHSKWLGLLGLATCLGLIILIVLPDHHKESK